jgi:hypothetical protein
LFTTLPVASARGHSRALMAAVKAHHHVQV